MKKTTIGTYGTCPIALLQEPWITLNALKAYIAIASSQGTNDCCWASRDFLATRAGLKKDKMSTAVSLLLQHGWVTVKRRFQKTNIYTILFDCGIQDVSETATLQGQDVAETTTYIDVSETATQKEKIKEKDKDIKEHTQPSGCPQNQVEPVQQSQTLYQKIQGAFLEKNDGKFSNYAKEGQAIKRLIRMLENVKPVGVPLEVYAMAVMETFYHLIHRSND
jgi:hypothetical protein